MGYEIYQEFPSAREAFQQASEVLGFDIARLCFEGPEEELRRTSNSQPCILTVSIAIWRSLPSLLPSFLLGHSLGEYTALVVGGSLSFPEAVRLVRLRGEYMEQCREGTMVAIIGLDRSTIEEVIGIARGICVIANLNSPQQVVISGETRAVQEVASLLKEKGGRCVPLPVSGAFHSPLMEEANKKFQEELERITFNDSAIPIIVNAFAKPLQRGEELKEALKVQMTNPVLWEDSVRYAFQFVDTFLEIGPGKVLTNLVRRIVPEAKAYNVENKSTLENIKDILWRGEMK